MIHTNSLNPNINKDRKTPPTIIVIFGASGDLTARKLVPAIFNLSKDELLPKRCFLIGYGRSKISDEEFKDDIKSALDGADIVFIAAGLGGGTGTGAAAIIAKAAKEV